ncbi:MAG: hypothetical protein OXC19_19590 [Bryobacterales bacterium]|nr:hypothetical protein [Bryobacterales bacterium]
MSQKLDAKVIAFVSKFRAVPRRARIIIASIAAVLTFFLNDWEKLLDLLRGVL